MKNVKRVELDNELVYFKKGLLGWHIVYPTKIDGKINWKNLIAGGSWGRLIVVGILVLLILGCIGEYANAVNVANECLSNVPKIQVCP